MSLRLFLDENASWRVASALRAVDLDCRAVGDDRCPPRGTPDREIVHWCYTQRRLLVTADRSSKRREMREAIEKYQLPYIQLARAPKPVPLLWGLLNAWDDIGVAQTKASAHRVQLRLNLDLVTGSVSRVRRGVAVGCAVGNSAVRPARRATPAVCVASNRAGRESRRRRGRQPAVGSRC